MNEMDFEKLSENPAWKKVRRFSFLQDCFLYAALSFAIIDNIFDPTHPFWIIAFLVAGFLSVVFGLISEKTFRKYFTQNDN